MLQVLTSSSFYLILYVALEVSVVIDCSCIVFFSSWCLVVILLEGLKILPYGVVVIPVVPLISA